MKILDVQKQCELKTLPATYELEEGKKYIVFLSPEEFRDPERFVHLPDEWKHIDMLFIAMSVLEQGAYTPNGRDLASIIKEFLKEPENVLTT